MARPLLFGNRTFNTYTAARGDCHGTGQLQRQCAGQLAIFADPSVARRSDILDRRPDHRARLSTNAVAGDSGYYVNAELHYNCRRFSRA